jgi:DNA-binding CsgD family transcriptional regulator
MILERFHEISQSPDIEAFRERLVRFAHDMDFGLVSTAVVFESDSPGDDAKLVSLTNAPEAYESTYASAADSMRDPVLKRLKRLSVPFFYDQSTYESEDVPELWEEQAAYGYKTGVAVALHLPGKTHFLLGMDRDKPLPRHPARLTRLLADLQLLAVHAQDAALRLLQPPVDTIKPPDLSERELEILRWTMHGKSAWAVGQLLSISEHTVNYHFRSMFRKLEVSSKHQAVLKAIGIGLLK